MKLKGKFSSLTPDCGHKFAQNRQSQSDFECEQYGYKNHADIVGALNVLAAGHAVLACSRDIVSISNQAQESPKDAA